MRILVLSDSHKDSFALFEAIDREPTAEYVYFLGDGVSEAEDAAAYYGDKKQFVIVRGNCDFCSEYPARDVRTINGIKILATHGYAENVKYGLYNLENDARGLSCSVAVFGHTHTPFERFIDGLYLFNPGSIHDGEYGVIDIIDGQLLLTNKKLIY